MSSSPDAQPIRIRIAEILASSFQAATIHAPSNCNEVEWTKGQTELGNGNTMWIGPMHVALWPL